MFSKEDLNYFSEKGISPKTVEQQINNFKRGFPFVNITKAATINDGIFKLNENEIDTYIRLFEKTSEKEKMLKFVPASGAASRMFKQLFEFKDNTTANFDDKGFNSTYNFFQKIEKFAFYDDLKTICSKANFTKDYKQVLDCLLEENGLNYGNLPKGLLKFHKYENSNRTPAEEHLAEGAEYSNSQGKVNIHFTISPEHKSDFKKHINEVKSIYENMFNVQFNIDFSIQKPSTDTIAVDLHNNPFRNLDDSILFRPGGHGALIENLNDIDADIIFVKNIDNIVPDRLKKDTITYKKALAGLLIEKRNQIFSYINQIQKSLNDKLIQEVKAFLENELFITLDNQFDRRSNTEKAKYLIGKLNRPVRVCGMVKNEGEPGGGPFFVQRKSGSVSLQIVEGAQIDINDSEKADIVNHATHFNPVDLITAVKDYKGDVFDLTKFIDPETGFISQKSKDGKDLKAQELPGLWNGAMANWNTLFVEVPISTFNPVKVVNDLLRETHQG